MKIVTIMPVRNEAWCLGLTARAALMWCDELVILDHASTDRTAEIASEIAGECSCRTCLAGGTKWLIGNVY
jgi:glycosyltransferase involved in cell wall biosynthesis